LKILHVAYIYPPRLDVADGITAVVYNVTKELAKRGHEVDVLTSDILDLHGNRSLSSGHSVVNGVNVYYAKSLWRSKTFIVTPSVFSLLSKKLFNYDIIHIHDCRSFQGISTFLLAKMKNVPYVFQPHGSYLSQSSVSPSKKVVKMALDNVTSDRLFRGASKVIALSQIEAEEYRRIGIPNGKIAIVPNGIDLSNYSDLPVAGSFRKKFGIEEKTKMVLYLGRVHKTKGIDILIKAYAYLIGMMMGSKTILVITGPDDGYLAKARLLASSLGVSSSVLFTGHVDEKDKLSALTDADVFLTPSFSGFPMTFLEACAMGTPIVTTTLGDTLEWINGNVGYVTSPTIADIANAVKMLISNVELANVFSRNCVSITRSKFSIETVVDKLEQVYAEVANA
jgi:glycosyltransferase involved in cell wall biosynthesis